MTTPDEFTELVDGDFPRVDLVGKAANGIPRFLIAKSADSSTGQAGLLEASIVRDLVESRPVKENRMTDVAKASKDMDPMVVLADVPKGVDGDPEEPGSAAWEAVDAATAMKWAGILSRARNALQMLAGREEIEAFTGAEADGTEAWDLNDAACAIDCALDLLAPYAVGEQAESDRMSEEVAKAATGLSGDLEALTVLEGLAPIIKAGRTLSGANESKIREAVASLQQVLSSLPAAPMEVAKMDAVTETSPFEEKPADSAADPSSPAGNPQAQAANDGHEITPTSDTTDLTVPSDVQTGTGLNGGDGKPGGDGVDQGVMKADKNLMAVFTQGGKMIGVVDPEKIQAVQTGEEAPAEEAPAEAEDTAPETPAEAAPADPSSDMAPAPAAAVGTPADDVTKASVAEVVKAVLAERDAEHASVVKALEDRLSHLEAPAKSRVLTNGVLPPTSMLRGMDQGIPGARIEKAEDMHARLAAAPDAESRIAIEKEMNAAASEALASLHGTR